MLLLGGLAKDVTHSRSTAESPLLRLGLLLSATGPRACAEGSMLAQKVSEVFRQRGGAARATRPSQASQARAPQAR